jgi:hypothetical protein
VKLTPAVRDALKSAGVDVPAPAKYRNRKVTVGGETWDSEREYARWLVLQAMERDGLIRDLRRQVPVDLVVNGVKVCRWVADATYFDTATGRVEWEDTKGFRTQTYRVKAKLFAAIFGQPIRET